MTETINPLNNLVSLTVAPEAAGLRLDKFLAEGADGLSRSRVQQLLEGGHVARLADGKRAAVTDASAKVKAGEMYEIFVPEAEPSYIEAQDIPLEILFEDAHLLVVNKPPGLTVHPAPGHRDHTLVNALLAHCGGSLSGIGGVARPGIVHRLDKDTSGLLVVAKNDTAHRALSEQLSARTMSRTYLALVWGVPKLRSGKIEGNIGRSPKNRQKMAIVARGGKHAVTHYKVIEVFDGYSLLECKLETGRTHQIRVHLTHLGHPLVGDQTYGKKSQNLFPRQALHAFRLEFTHPATGKTMAFEAKLPEDMRTLLETLRAT